MNTMTWEQIEKDWNGLQKRHRMELAQAITRYCVGHKIKDVAGKLGFSYDWTVRQLDYAGLGAASGGGPQVADLPLAAPVGKSGGKGVDHAVSRLVKEYGPSVDIQITSDDDNDRPIINSIKGDDAEVFQTYLDHYLEDGHEPAAAARLAKAEWAGEAALEAGVIKETKNKRDKRVNQILFPNDKKDSFELSLKMHMANVRRAATFLDEAKMTFLKKESTAAEVASTHAKWLEQVERIRNLHPTFA